MASQLMAYPMEMVKWYGPMEMCLKDNLNLANAMEQARESTKMDHLTTENTLMISLMGEVIIQIIVV